jgi:hypothetical protein
MPTRPRDPRDLKGKRGFTMVHIVSAVVLITTATGLITFQLVKDRQLSVAIAKAWEIKGASCPAFTQADFQSKRYTALKTFDYDGTTIGRTAGDADCADVKSGGGKGFSTDKVCQFTSPATLTVRSKAGMYYFVPGIGQPASLYIHHDVPRCIMASHFTLQNEAS